MYGPTQVIPTYQGLSSLVIYHSFVEKDIGVTPVAFITGADQEPPLGFVSLPKISFLVCYSNCIYLFIIAKTSYHSQQL